MSLGTKHNAKDGQSAEHLAATVQQSVTPSRSNKVPNRANPFRAMLHLWCYDLGAASFLFTAALGIFMGTLFSLQAKVDGFELLFSMGITSTSASIAWQLNRLIATEWAGLVPHYRRNILIQAASLYLAVNVLGFGLCGYLGLGQVASSFLLTNVLSLSFLLLCQYRTNAFYGSFLLFVLVPFIPYVSSAIPAWGYGLLLIGLSLALAIQLQQLKWHASARSVYLNGIEMGWFWLPHMRSSAFLSRFERYLHPMNFFIGPMLSVLLVCIVVGTVLLAIASRYFGWQLPVLMLMSQFFVVICSLVHWSRIQRWRAAETLYLLPGFSGRQGLVDAFYRGQLRLVTILVLLAALVSLFVCVIDAQIPTTIAVHVTLSVCWGASLMLGGGCFCRSALHLSACILCVLGHSVWLSLGMKQLSAGLNESYWFIGDFGLLMFSFAVLFWGKKWLWRHDICAP